MARSSISEWRPKRPETGRSLSGFSLRSGDPGAFCGRTGGFGPPSRRRPQNAPGSPDRKENPERDRPVSGLFGLHSLIELRAINNKTFVDGLAYLFFFVKPLHLEGDFLAFHLG